MSAGPVAILLASAVLCLGVAMLIGHPLPGRVLTVAGTILAGGVLVVSLL